MEKIKTLLRFFFGVPLTIVAFFFIGKFIYESRTQIFTSFDHVDILLLIIGLILICIFFFFRSLLWKSVLDLEGYKPSVVESTYLLASSELKRYVPVGVLAIIGRVNSFQVYKIPSKTILKLIMYESVLFFIASIVLSIPGAIYLIIYGKFDPKIIFSVILLLVVITIVGFFFAKKKNIQVFENFSKYLSSFVLILCAWSFFGLGNYLVLSSFTSLSPTHILQISSFFVLAWLVGYVAFIFPLGLGIREGFLTYSLSSFTPIGTAAALSIISRVAFVLVEVIFVLLAFFVYKYLKPRPKIEASNAILTGMIFSFILYFTSIIIRNNLNPLLIVAVLITSIGSLVVYKNSQNIIKNKNLSILLTGSFLVNPIVQNSLVDSLKNNLFSPMFLTSIATGVILYLFIAVVINIIFAKRIAGANLVATIVIILTVVLVYLFGKIPGSLNPYIF